MNEERTLDLTLRFTAKGIETTVHEPESGETSKFLHKLDFENHEDFDRDIGNEIFSWLSLWADAMEACQAEEADT